MTTDETTRYSIQFRPGEDLENELMRRLDGVRGANYIAKRDLARYYALLDAELTTIHLTEAEWNFLRDLTNGTIWGRTSVRYLWAEADDADPELDEKWDVNRAQLVSRLRKLTPAQAWAIADQIERFWAETHAI